MSASAPPVVTALSRLGGSLYRDHIERRPTLVYQGSFLGGQLGPCRCSETGPDAACETGHALDRMRKADVRRFDDGRRTR